MISLLVVTYNEAHRIAEMLRQNRTFVDEIVVVDQSSTDGTAEIARRYADVVLIDPHYGFCQRSRPRAAAASSGDWLLLLDADEWIDYPEADVLRKLAAQALEGYYLWRASDLDGKRVADEQIYRFFRREAVMFREQPSTNPEPVPQSLRAFSPYPPIRHTKSRAEAALDDARRRSLMHAHRDPPAAVVEGVSPGASPRIALVVVPPCATHANSTLERHRRYVDDVIVLDRSVPPEEAWEGIDSEWVLFLNDGEYLDYPDDAVLRRLIGTGQLDGFYLWRATDRADHRVADEKVFRFFKRGCGSLADPRARVVEILARPGTHYAFVPFPIVRRALPAERSAG